MRVLVTGGGGTLGSVLCRLLSQKKIEVIKWNRRQTSITDYPIIEDYIKAVHPDIVFHLAMVPIPSVESWLVNYEWTSELAWITRQHGIKFLFTSTNLVFSGDQSGPFTASSLPDAVSGYGYEKRRAEEQILHQNPDAIIARLGWQIGNKAGSNNMIDYLERQMHQYGQISANINWKPASSFLTDTVEKLIEMGAGFSPGVYMLDSNKQWNFFEIATALNVLHNYRWKIVRIAKDVLDNRMIDERINMPSLKNHLQLSE